MGALCNSAVGPDAITQHLMLCYRGAGMKVEEELDVDALMDTREDSGDAAEGSQPGNSAVANPASNGPAAERPAHQLPDAGMDLKPEASGPRSGRLCSTKDPGAMHIKVHHSCLPAMPAGCARVLLLWSG